MEGTAVSHKEMSSKDSGLTEENETYAAGGYKKNAHGFNYQLKLLMLIFYRSVKKYKKFKLATEMEAAGKFDDIVFEYEDEDGKTKTVLIQCKHKAEKNDNKLYKLKDFCLETYFSSYLKIKKDKMFDNKSMKSLILYTNANSDVSFQADGRLIEVNPKEKIVGILQSPGFIKSKNSEPRFYQINNIQSFSSTIQSDMNAGKITKNDVEEFEAKFILAINQPNEKELDEIIKDELGEEFNIVDSELAVSNLYYYMHKWMSDQKGKFITEEVGEVFFKELKEKIRQMEIEGVIFENSEKKMTFGNFFESTKDLENKFALANSSFLHVISQSPSLTIIKIVQSLENKDKFIVLNLRMLLAFANKVKDTFFSRHEFTIYAECTSIDEHLVNEAKILLDELLKQGRTENGKKGIVMITNKNDKFVESLKTGFPFARIDDHSDYNDLTHSAKERILDYNVNFQGCDIKLRDIVHENWEDILDWEILNRIVERDEIKIGKSLKMTHEMHSVYINRLLKIKRHQTGKKIRIIEGGPGIGKSTELANMAFKEKNENKNTFSLSINLLDYSSEFEEVKEFGKETLLNFLIKSQNVHTEFEICILKHQLFFIGEITIFFDGFDEISPNYEKSVISLIKSLVNETKIRKIWVTTRPHATDVLVKEFEAAIYQIRPFDENDRKEFLQKYWIHLLKIRHDIESVGLFADKLLNGIHYSGLQDVRELIGIPLQMRMIAELFADQCKAYWESKGHREVEFKSINVYELFKNFINKKFEIYFREKAQMDRENPRMKMFEKNELKRDKNELQKMAFRLIFPNDYAAFVKSSKEEIVTELLSVGIIEKRNDSSVFIHRTFAEYFAAEFLAEKLRRVNKNEELIEFLNCNYFKWNFGMIRYFLDHILAEDSEIHRFTIENDLNRLKELIDENRSLLLKKDVVGRIPLHLSCFYSTFPGTYMLHFPVNNVLDFLIFKDVETNKPTQILEKDILNFTPFAYAYYSKYGTRAFDLLKWNYFEYHFSNDLDFNKIGMQFLHKRNLNICFIPISYTAESKNMDEICQNGNFKAIKPCFYGSKEKLLVCKRNNYKILKPALKSYFTDVFCQILTDRDYYKELDDELRNLQLCQEWFSEAIQTKDYAFLLGITLACPKTAYILWKRENYVDFFMEPLNQRDARLQKDTKMEKKCEIGEFFSNNKLKNFLILAFCRLFKKRGVKPPTQMNCVEYFKTVATDDYISFKISLELVDDQDREEIPRKLKDAMVRNVIMAIKRVNPEKLFNAYLYFYDTSYLLRIMPTFNKPFDYEACVDVHSYMNTDVHATIAFMKKCLKNKDTTGIDLMLSYSICYFCGQEDYHELQHALCETRLIEWTSEFVVWQKRRTEYRRYFFSWNEMKDNILRTIDHTLDHYSDAVSRGYPFSITQHIISQIAWINTKGVPTFIEKHFLRDSDQFPFSKTIIHDVKNGQLKDLLRYFMFANEEQRNAVLKANESELIKYLIKAKCEHIDAQTRAANEDSEPRPFMSEEYSSEVINSSEYGICLVHAFERNNLLMLTFLNIFFKNNADILFGENANLCIVLKNALNQMNDEWVEELFELMHLLDKIELLGLSDDELQIWLVEIFNDSIYNFNKIMFRNEERDKYWHPTMYNEAFKKAVIEKDYERLKYIVSIKDYKPEWIKNMKELVELQDYINCIQCFVEKNQSEGLNVLLLYIGEKESAEVSYYTGETRGIKGIYIRCHSGGFAELQWKQLIKYVSKFRYGISRGLRCSILKYLDYCVRCISAKKDLPKCISCYFDASDYLTFVNHVDECIKLQRNGNLKELCEWFYNSSLDQKQEILRANNYEILKDAFQADYFEELLIYFEETNHFLDKRVKRSLHVYTDIISENEIFVLHEYIECVAIAFEMKDFAKLRRLTEFLCFENQLELYQKVDYEDAFKDALKYDNYKVVAQLLRLFQLKCDELCALPEFITYMNKALEYNINYFNKITNILSHAQKSKVLKAVDYVSKFKAVLLSRDSRRLMQLHRIYKNENVCFKEVFLKVKFRNFLKYCQHFINKQKVKLITKEGGIRLKSLFDLDWIDASKNTPDTSQCQVNELTVSVEFLDKFPSAARGYPWSTFFYACCVAICHIKSKSIPRCISIYFEEENGENPVNYIGETRKVIEAGYVNKSLLWLFMATDEQQKEIFKDDFMKGYFAKIFKNYDFALMVYFSPELEAEILSLSAFTDRIEDAIENEEFHYLADVTKCLSKKTQVSLWKQTNYNQIYRDAVKNHDRKMKELIYSLFYSDEKLQKYY